MVTLQSLTVLSICGFACFAQAGIFFALLESTKPIEQRSWLGYQVLMGLGFFWLVSKASSEPADFNIFAAILIMSAFLVRFIAVATTNGAKIQRKPLVFAVVAILVVACLYSWSLSLGAPLGSLETIILLPLGVAAGVTAWYQSDRCSQNPSFAMLWMSRVLWVEAIVFIVLALGALAGIGQDYVNPNSSVILNLSLFAFLVQLILHVLWVIHSAVDKTRVFKSSVSQSKLQLRLPKQFQAASLASKTAGKRVKRNDDAISKLASGAAHLTSKELEVLRLVVDGKKNKEIAELMQISEASVKVHKSRMTGKLGVKSVPELTLELNKIDMGEQVKPEEGAPQIGSTNNTTNPNENES